MRRTAGVTCRTAMMLSSGPASAVGRYRLPAVGLLETEAGHAQVAPVPKPSGPTENELGTTWCQPSASSTATTRRRGHVVVVHTAAASRLSDRRGRGRFCVLSQQRRDLGVAVGFGVGQRGAAPAVHRLAGRRRPRAGSGRRRAGLRRRPGAAGCGRRSRRCRAGPRWRSAHGPRSGRPGSPPRSARLRPRCGSGSSSASDPAWRSGRGRRPASRRRARCTRRPACGRTRCPAPSYRAHRAAATRRRCPSGRE